MVKGRQGLLGALALSLLMLIGSPSMAPAAAACGGGFCQGERSACLISCNRCGVSQFTCSVGSPSCYSDCVCRLC
jgi:hypothetical protein